MLVISDSQARVIERKSAKGIKKLIIESDVSRGDEVKFCIEGDSFRIAKDPEADIENPKDLVFVLNEIGLFGGTKGLSSEVEIVLCDDCFLLRLVKGAVVIRPEGKMMQASWGIDDSTIPASHSDAIRWVSVNDLKSMITSLTKGARYARMFPEDYIFHLTISGDNRGSESNFFSIKPLGESEDISNGAIAKWEYEVAMKLKAKEAEEQFKAVTSSHSDDYEFEDDDFDDDDEDDYDEEYFDEDYN